MAIVSIGHIGNLALKAAQNLENEGLSVAFYDARFVKPLDAEMFHEICSEVNSFAVAVNFK